MKIKEDVTSGGTSGGGGGRKIQFSKSEPMEEKPELRRREAEGQRKENKRIVPNKVIIEWRRSERKRFVGLASIP